MAAQGWCTSKPISISTIAAHQVRLVGVVHDITERRAAEQALQRAHDELELRVHEPARNWPWPTRQYGSRHGDLRPGSSLSLAIIVLDPWGQVKSWNPAAEKMFGWQEAEVLGQSLPTHPDYMSEYEQMQLDSESLRAVPCSASRRNVSGAMARCSMWPFGPPPFAMLAHVPRSLPRLPIFPTANMQSANGSCYIRNWK